MSLTQLSQLLPLPEEDLRQVLDYAATLSKPDAASHFSNLLGDSPLAVDFIASFNARRDAPAPSGANAAASGASNPGTAGQSGGGVPRGKRNAGKKPKKNIHALEARKVENYGAPAGTVYSKKDLDLEYTPQNRASAPNSGHASRSGTPKPAQPSTKPPEQQPPPQQAKQLTTAAGYLISEMQSKAKIKAKSNPTSRSSTPKPGGSTKISISGGMPMAGQSTALTDLDNAIRALEVSTNPSLDDLATRKCNCIATRHPLQSAAPNCLACGKVVCVKEGLGPCTFCGASLLTAAEVQAMVRGLREERGRERMAAHAEANRRPAGNSSSSGGNANKPMAFTPAGGWNDDENLPTIAQAEVKAREHRDRLLGFQAQNARRTTVRDEAADFDVSVAAGSQAGSMWTTPEERAKELRRQQKVMREQEWAARPEYERRTQVLSIDVVGGKVVRKMAERERPPSAEPDEEAEETYAGVGRRGAAALAETSGNAAGRQGGAFSRNPLLGALIKPVFETKGKGVASGDGGDEEATGRRERSKGWRRVQDDLDDNEGVILDGGIYGHNG